MECLSGRPRGAFTGNDVSMSYPGLPHEPMVAVDRFRGRAAGGIGRAGVSVGGGDSPFDGGEA